MIPSYFLSVSSAVGKGLVMCTGTAVLKPKNNPQSVVHCEQNTPITEEQPSGGNLPKLLNRFTRKIPRTSIQTEWGQGQQAAKDEID